MQNIAEDRTCNSEDMIADRQAQDRHTQTEKLITTLCFPIGGGVTIPTLRHISGSDHHPTNQSMFLTLYAIVLGVQYPEQKVRSKRKKIFSGVSTSPNVCKNMLNFNLLINAIHVATILYENHSIFCVLKKLIGLIGYSLTIWIE